MKSLTIVLLLTTTAVIPVGCSKGASSPKPAATHTRAADKDQVEVNNVAIEADEQAIQLNAERAKRDIDAISAEAAHALRKTRENQAAEAKKRVHEVSERAVELAEDAKDRAEDLPEELDQSAQTGEAKLRSKIRDLELEYEESLARERKAAANR